MPTMSRTDQKRMMASGRSRLRNNRLPLRHRDVAKDPRTGPAAGTSRRAPGGRPATSLPRP